MTTTEFQTRFPKPWRFVLNSGGISVKAANGTTVAWWGLSTHHSGIPQKEWNRHVAAALAEFLPLETGNAAPKTRSENHPADMPISPTLSKALKSLLSNETAKE